MKSTTAIFKKSVALLLAVLFTLPTANITVVAEKGSVSVTSGNLTADNYEGLSDGEKAILVSALVIGGTYTYHTPDGEDGLVSINSESKTVTARVFRSDGLVWTPVSAVIVYADGKTGVELVKRDAEDVYDGSFDYAGNNYNAEVTYAATVPVDAALQSKLLNGPYYLNKSLDNIEILCENEYYFESISSMKDTLNSLIDGSLPMGVKLTTQSTIDAINAISDQVENNGGSLDIELMLQDYENAESRTEYLFTNGGELKAKMIETYNYVNDIYNDEGISTLIEFLGSSSSTGRNLAVIKRTMKNLLDGIEEPVNDEWAILDSENDPFRAGLTTDEYKALDDLADGAADAQYHDDEIKAELSLQPVVITTNVNRHNVTVNVTANTVTEADSAELSDLPSHSVILKLPDGMNASALSNEITSSGIEAEALSDWKTVDTQHYTRTASELPAALNDDITYTISYTPKTYTITYDFETDLPVSVPYGYVMTLPVHGGEELVYDYYTANGTHYFEGETIKITGDTAISRTEGKAWSALKKDQIAAMIYSDTLTDEEKAVLNSSALISGEVMIRVPDEGDGLIDINVYGESVQITARDYPSGIYGLNWIPVEGYALNGTETVARFDIADGQASLSADMFSSVKIRYALQLDESIITGDEVLAALNTPKALADDIKDQQENMEKLNGIYEYLEQLNKTTLNRIRVGVNGSEMTEEAKESAKTVLDECVDPETEKLYLYEYMTEYRAEGLSYYYRSGNHGKIEEQVRILNANLSTIYNDDGFYTLLEDTGKSEYYDKIGEIITTLSGVELTAPNALADADDPMLSELITAVLGMADDARAFDFADKENVLYTDLVVAAPDRSVVTVTVQLQGSSGAVKASSEFLIFSSVDALTDDDITTVTNTVNRLVANIGIDGVHYETNDALTLSAGDVVTENTTVTITYAPKTYTTVIKDGEGVTIDTKDFSFDNPRITLPACAVSGHQYRYTVSGDVITVGTEPKTYTFSAEQIDGGEYAVITAEAVEIVRINVTDTDGNNIYAGTSLSDAFAAAVHDSMIEIIDGVTLDNDIALDKSVILIGADKITFGGNGIVISDPDVQLTSSDISIKGSVRSGDTDHRIEESASGGNYIYALKTNIYKIIFKADGVAVAEVEYTYNASSVEEPDVPEKEGFTGKWEEYTLNSAEVITVNAVYTEIISKITVTAADGAELYKGDDINAAFDNAKANNTITVTGTVFLTNDISLDKAVALVGGAYMEFGAYKFILTNTGASLTVEASAKDKIKIVSGVTDHEISEDLSGDKCVYSLLQTEPDEHYKVVFKADGKIVATIEYEYGASSVAEPDVPVKAGYTGVWEAYTLNSAEVITVNAVYTKNVIKITVTAQGGQTLYKGSNIQTAFEKAEDNSTITVTGAVSLTKNVSLDKAVTVVGGTNIDFGDHTITLTDVKASISVEPKVKNRINVISESADYKVELSLSGMNVVYSLTPVIYKVIFEADGKTVATIEYKRGETSVTEPAVPEKPGYTGKWGKYTLNSAEVITVNAVYTKTVIKITVTAQGGQTLYKGSNIQTAFEKAEDNSTITVTGAVSLTKNVSLDKAVTVVGGTNIDFGDHTITLTDVKASISVEPKVKNRINVISESADYKVELSLSGMNIVYSLTPVIYKVIFEADGKTVATVEYARGAKSITEPSVPAKTGYTGKWGKYTLNSAEQITVKAIYTATEAPETKVKIKTTAADGTEIYLGDDIYYAFDSVKNGGTVTVTGDVELTKDISLDKAVTLVGAEHIKFGEYSVLLDKNSELTADLNITDHIKSGSEYSEVYEAESCVYKLKALVPKILSANVDPDTENILGFEFDKVSEVLILDILDPESITNKTHAGNGITADELIKAIGYDVENAEKVTASVSYNGNPCSGTSLVPTGAKMTITASNPDCTDVSVVTYTIVILGDVNCNGRVDSGDAKLMFDYYMGKKELTGFVLMAADINRNGRVDSGDAVKNTVKYSRPADYTTGIK